MDVSLTDSRETEKQQEVRLTIDSTLDVDVAVRVPGGSVSGEVEAGVGLEVGLEVSGVVLVDGPRDRRPRLGDDEHTLNVVALELITSRRAGGRGRRWNIQDRR